MQLSLVNSGPLERRLTVQVPEEQIAQEVQARLKRLSRNVRLDGFRPGRAPLSLVERRFATQVRKEVVGEVLRRSLAEAMREQNLRPAGEPVIDPIRSAPGEGLSYTATFEVYPDISLAPVEELRVQRPVCAISEAEVERMIETLRLQRRTWRVVDRPAARGDKVNIDFHGTVEGEDFAGGSAEGFEVEIGAGRFIAGFEEGLAGMAVGEHRLEVSFPPDYHRKELAGRTAQFRIKVNSVAEPVLPALDEELFAAFGVKEGGLEAFRAEVRRNMERERDAALRQLTRQRALEALRAANPVELPRALVEGEAKRLLREAQANLLRQGVPKERVAELDEARFRERAARRVGLGLILGEIVVRNGLKVDPARVRARVEELAASYEDPAAVVKWFYEDRQRLAEIETSVLEDQAVEWVLQRAQVTEGAVSFDDLMKERQTG